MASAEKKSELQETEEKRKTWYSEYEKEYDFVRKCSSSVRDSDYKLHCMACNIDLCCAGGGRNDIYKHSLLESLKGNYIVNEK